MILRQFNGEHQHEAYREFKDIFFVAFRVSDEESERQTIKLPGHLNRKRAAR